jgi:DNA repair protein RAD7
VIGLLEEVGSNLTSLNLSNHILLTDDVLELGIKPCATSLRSLSLNNLPELTDAGVFKFFSTWTDNPPLFTLDMSRNPELSTEALDALLTHSGECLQDLDINGWKDVEGEMLGTIGKKARELRTLNLSWCRATDDFIVRDILADCKGLLKEIKVWGCRVEGKWALDGKRRAVRVHGIESRRAM